MTARTFTFGLAAAAIVMAAAALPRAALADLNVFACEPEWASLVKEIGGDKVTIYTATTAAQDPHHIQARPSLIARARSADLMVCTGAELEIGWLPAVQRQAGNPKVQSGAKGYVEAASFVRMLDVPTNLDRSQGDVHAAGNPHIQSDPRNIALVARPLAEQMAEIDPGNAALYRTRYADFAQRWSAAMQRWQQKAEPLRGLPVATQHKTWIYLFDWVGLRETVTLEPKPGVPPSSGHLALVLDAVHKQPVRMVIRSNYEDPRPADFLRDRAKVPLVVLPATVGGSDKANDLFGLYDDILDRLLAALRAG